ncbi:unnamed protein product, partial [Rotaria sp. Silwood1]
AFTQFCCRWSRHKGRGHIIIRTPLNNTIYYGKPRTNSSFDEGRHQQIGDGNQIDNIYWPSNSIPLKGSYKICFSTGSLFNDTDKSPITVTIEIRRFRQEIETMTRTFNKSTTKLSECIDTSDTFVGSFPKVTCVWPFVLTSSTTCVNTLIDRNHCGMVGHKCNTSDKGCSNGVCFKTSASQLNQPKIIWQGNLNETEDFEYFSVTLPVNITVYNKTTNNVSVTANGVFCVGLCSKKFEFPSQSKSEFIYALAYVAWSPLYKNNERSAKISYNIYGNTPSRTVAFEFNETIYEKQDKKQYLHFQVLFFEAQPNIIQFIYLDVSSSGKSGPIGVLSMDERPMLRYSPEQPFFMLQDVSITFDTNNNTYTAVHFCGSKTCTMNEACIQEMCVERGNLSFVARWSRRNGRGHLIIRTPLNNTIYYGKPRTNSSSDEGRHALVDDGNQVDHIYWPLNSIPPIGTYKILCFDKCTGYEPMEALPSYHFNSPTALPYWDELVISDGTSEGIYYFINGNTSNRTVIFEYYLTHDTQPNEYCHFQVLFFEAKPNIVQYIYLDVTNGGKTATVGIQGSSSGPFIQYSFQQPFSILPNMSIAFDTNNNTYTVVLLCGSKTCTMDEVCIQDMCVKRGSLSFVARWSRRKGRGHLTIRTPLNNTIYYGKPHTNSSIDEGRHQRVGDGSQVDRIYWPLKSIAPKGSYKICFSTGSLLNGTDKSPVTVTIEIQRFGLTMKTLTHTFNRSTRNLDECINTSDAFVGFSEIRWSMIDTMKTTRIKHTASRLLNGKVLVVGGTKPYNLFNTVELYDPLPGKWTRAAYMSTPRSYHTASVLLDGKVLVVGGKSHIALNTAELYDPLLGKWTNVGSMSTFRTHHTASVLLDGKVLVVGGDDGDDILNTAELFDPVSKEWSNVGNMTDARKDHTASVLLDRKILIVGGSYNYFSKNTAELYDPLSGKWTNVANMTTARKSHTASVLLDGKVLVVGGYDGDHVLNTAELYDPLSRKWTKVGNMIGARKGHTASLLPDGKVLVIGGDTESSTLNTAELYDPSTRSWILTESMTYPRESHVSVELLDGKVLVTGGLYYYNRPLDNGELYDP